jgi:hypothetical protein
MAFHLRAAAFAVQGRGKESKDAGKPACGRQGCRRYADGNKKKKDAALPGKNHRDAKGAKGTALHKRELEEERCRAYGAGDSVCYGSQPWRAGLPGTEHRDARGANFWRAYGAPVA